MDETTLESRKFKPEEVREALLDLKAWLIWFAIIALQVPKGGLTTFRTLIISDLSVNNEKTALLAMPLGAMSTLLAIDLNY